MKISRKKIVLLIIVTLLSLIVLIIFILAQLQASLLKNSTDSPKEVSYPNNNPVSYVITTDNVTYIYSKSYIKSKFSIKFPFGKVNYCDASGCWDINDSTSKGEISIDFSNVGDIDLDKAADEWITDFGNDIKFKKTVLESNNTYSTYDVNSSSEGSYKLAIVNIYSKAGGYLAVKTNGFSDSEIKQIINSIKFLN